MNERVSGMHTDNLIEEFRWRGIIEISTDQDELRSAFENETVTFYCGFDPTAPSLHIGNMAQLITMRRIQDYGHKPIILVGGATGLIGDPRKSGERILNSESIVAEWVESISGQAARFVSFKGPNSARVLDNMDWIGSLSALELLRDVGKHFRVGRMLTREAVAARLNSKNGISFTEFSYQILQGIDFRELNRRYGCTVQIGGSDQWGNLTAGVELARRSDGANLHLLATPLVTNTSGEKFGKTEGGAVWLDPSLTSPYEFFQFWVNVEDAKVVEYLKIFSSLTRTQISALEAATNQKPGERQAQKVLALEMTTIVHGPEVTEQVRTASNVLFGDCELSAIDKSSFQLLTEHLPVHQVRAQRESVVDLLVNTGLARSKLEARRAISNGGVYVNNSRISGVHCIVGGGAELLHGRWTILRRGRKLAAVVDFVEA